MTLQDSTPRSRRTRALAPLIAASTIALLAPRISSAQSDAPDCVAIVAEMLTPSPSTGAIRASAGCPSSGPVTLANRWTRRGTRTTSERTALVETSTLMRDARLYDAVSTVVRDGSYPTTDRLAGLRVLTSYADAGSMVSQQGQARETKTSGASNARRADASATTGGSVGLRPTVRADVRRELARLAKDDRDPDVRWAAQAASETLGHEMPSKGKAAPARSR
jgi:hypothetical protein